jgi:hypothetical protein
MKRELLWNEKHIFCLGIVPDFFYLSSPLLVLILGVNLYKSLEVFNGIVVMILFLELAQLRMANGSRKRRVNAVAHGISQACEM